MYSEQSRLPSSRVGLLPAVDGKNKVKGDPAPDPSERKEDNTLSSTVVKSPTKVLLINQVQPYPRKTLV